MPALVERGLDVKQFARLDTVQPLPVRQASKVDRARSGFERDSKSPGRTWNEVEPRITRTPSPLCLGDVGVTRRTELDEDGDRRDLAAQRRITLLSTSALAIA
jgi:hypothetical protein